MTDRSSPSLAELCDTLIHSRQHISPKHLGPPGPDDATLRQLLAAATAAPDHRQLRPWRFLVLGPAAREALGQAFAQALRERDPAATEAQQAEARDKALRGPVLLLAVVDLRADAPDVAPMERVLSLGCAMQNLMLAAQARGLASGLSSGRALASAPLRKTFGLVDGEHALCFLTLGTPRRSQPGRPRPAVDDIARWVP